MLLEISGEINPERMKGWSQNKNNTQLWMGLVIEARSDAVRAILQRNLECYVHESRQIGSGQTGAGKSERRHCAAAAAAKSLQSCPTLCDPIDSSPPGSSVPGILQARTLE